MGIGDCRDVGRRDDVREDAARRREGEVRGRESVGTGYRGHSIGRRRQGQIGRATVIR